MRNSATAHPVDALIRNVETLHMLEILLWKQLRNQLWRELHVTRMAD
jgi:hypothetical protein